MPAFTNPKTWINGEALVYTSLNLLGSALETFLNVTKLNSTNIQAGGVSLANLATPYHVYTVTLHGGEGGTGTGRALADFQGYSEVLDAITLLGDGVIVGMSVVGCTDACDPSQTVQLWIKQSGSVEAAIADSEVACVAAGVGTAPQTATLNQAYVSGDILRLKMSGATSLAQLPVRVTVTLREALRS